MNAPALLVTASRSLNAPTSPRWRRHLTGRTSTLTLDSDHYQFLRQPLAGKVATSIHESHNT